MKKIIENRRGDYQSPAKAGISLISLVITIIVIIILAAIVIFTGLGTPEKAQFAQLASDLSGLQEVVAQKYSQRYAELSIQGATVKDREIYRWVAVGDALNTTSGVKAVQSNEAQALYNISYLPDKDNEGNDILWYVKVLTDDEKDIVEINETTNKLGVQLPRYEGRTWKMRVADGLVMLDPPYEYEGKQYASIEDITNGGGTYASNSESLANAPILNTGMIPVYYDESEKVWKKADESNEGNTWYNYNAKKWANMVTVSKTTYRSASVGTAIPEEDILGYWVWIPRFAYKLNAGTVDVVFLNGKSKTLPDETTGADNPYKVHPAFTKDVANGGWDEELEGIWVAKFEASNSKTTLVDDTASYVIGDGKISDATSISNRGNITGGFPKFIPNVTSWRSVDVGTIYTKSQATAVEHHVSGTDSHMMKNSEWGAVAYLCKSQYGLGATDIYPNSYYEGEGSYTTQTGMCASEPDDSCTNGWVKTAKEYADGSIKITYDGHGTKTFYTYNSPNGMKASTTGNVYGVYDMSGGSWEYMASFVANTTYNNNKRNIDAGKYGTKYVASSEDTAAKNLEANTNMYGDAVYETKGWNGDSASFPCGSNPWFLRGGIFGSGSYCGVFAFNGSDGSAYNYHYSFRVVLVP